MNSAPQIASCTLDLLMVKALAHVVDDPAVAVLPWARERLGAVLYKAEDEVLDRPAPDLGTAAWKMTRMGSHIDGFELTTEWRRRLELLREDIDRILGAAVAAV